MLKTGFADRRPSKGCIAVQIESRLHESDVRDHRQLS